MSAQAADRNLLFGILALQMDFITKEALVAATSAWMTHKDKALGDILKEQGALDEEHRVLLSALVKAHLKKHDDDPQQSLAAAPVTPWLREQIKSIVHSDFHASLAQLGEAGAHV